MAKYWQILCVLLLMSAIAWIIHINTNSENLIEESLAIQKMRDSLAQANKNLDYKTETKQPQAETKEKIIIFEFKEGLAIASYKNQFGFVNKQKRPITAFKYDKVDNFSEGMAAVSSNYQWGFINAEGQEVIKIQYDAVMHYSEGMAGFKVGDIWGFIDKNGKQLISPQYETIAPFKDGKAQVSIKNRKFFYINIQGKCVKNCK